MRIWRSLAALARNQQGPGPQDLTSRVRSRRGLKMEKFEERVLLAIGPDLLSLRTNDGEITGDVHVAPRSLVLEFDESIDPTTLGGIQIVRAGPDGALDTPDDVTIQPGFIGLNLPERDNEVLLRFAEILPDDTYQLTIFGMGADPLRGISGDAFNGGVDIALPDVELDLGAQVKAVVPQPRRDSSGALIDDPLRKIVVYFNDDDLDQASAENADFYQLIFTNDTATTTDDSRFPTSVDYDPMTDTATLTFAMDLDELGIGTFRLRIGNDDALPSNPISAMLSVSGDPGSSFDSAAQIVDNLGNPRDLGDATQIINEAIEPKTYDLTLPGGIDEPGHREIPPQLHLNADADSTQGISTIFFNFEDFYGFDPEGNPLFNVITENQKERTRAIFEFYNDFAGVQFVELPETVSAHDVIAQGEQVFVVVTGDLRAIRPNIVPTGPGGQVGVAGPTFNPNFGQFVNFVFLPDVAIMDAAEIWGESEFGGDWFQTGMHEIGVLLGLGHTDELPPLTIQNDDSGQVPEGAFVEPVFPGDHDIVHVQHLHRPESIDIDLYQFDVFNDGIFTAEIIAERLPDSSLLDSALVLYNFDRELIAQNDDYFSEDSFIEIALSVGTYYVGVMSTGLTDVDPTIEDSGFGGTTQGEYKLRLNFDNVANNELLDTTGTALDGDADGAPGGVFNFWFNVASPADTKYVDRSAPDDTGDGSFATPFKFINDALAVAGDGDIVRILGNAGADSLFSTLDDNLPYEIGLNDIGMALDDGATLDVPMGVTVMVDAGVIFKLRRANITVGSTTQGVDRSEAALQILGTPDRSVFFTSWNDELIGVDTNPGTSAVPGDWGGLVFRNDADRAAGRNDAEAEGIFLNYVNHADIRYGGGSVVVDSVEDNFGAIHLIQARPTISFNTLSNADLDMVDIINATAPISADPNSFEETLFRDDSFTADYRRVGPDIHGNHLEGNSINGLFIRTETPSLPGTLSEVTVSARWDDDDIVHVLGQNLRIAGTPGGRILDETTFNLRARLDGRLAIDPDVIVKLDSAGIETRIGSQFIAEGDQGHEVIFTSLHDDRYGAGGTFDTDATGDTVVHGPGDWTGLFFGHLSSASMDHTLVTLAGGVTAIEGNFAQFNAIEIHQANVRLTNSVLRDNTDGISDPNLFNLDDNRAGRGPNDSAAVFVRGAQPILVGNVLRENEGYAFNVNVNSLNSFFNADPGRTTGPLDRFDAFDANRGPLVAENRMINNDINGLVVRGGVLTTESVWDDRDIVHVVLDEITVQNHHTYSGLRLESTAAESLIVKLRGDNAGFTATGTELDIDDRIGGTVQIIGQPGSPVVLTALADDSVGAGLTPEGPFGFGPGGSLQTDTNNSEEGPGELPSVGEVDNGTLIDNDAPEDVVGFFSIDVLDGGETNISGNSGMTAQGETALFTNQNFIFEYFNLVDVGSDGGAVRLSATTVSGPATLGNDDTVVSSGSFMGDNGLVSWSVESRIADGSDRYENVITFSSAQPLGSLRFVSYLHEDIDLFSDDLVRSVGAPGEAGFRAQLIDDLQRIGFSQGGIYTAGAGLVGATYDGWAADQFTDLIGGITGGGITYSLPGEVNELNMPAFNDPELGEVFGPSDATAAFAWTVDPAATTATITTFLEAVSRNPGATRGEWRSVRLESFSNDRNVETINEVEGAYTTDLNEIPFAAQFLGELAPDLLSGDDNRRLGFEVHGFIAFNDRGDEDVYSFNAQAGSEVWFDLDRTTQSLDTVIELIDANGNVIASSDNSPDEALDPMPPTPTNLARVMQRDVFHGNDLYTINPRDAGMRVVLPGPDGFLSTYFIRVRSKQADPADNALTISFTAGQAEEVGMPAETDDTGTVMLNFPLDRDITVTLVTSNPGEVLFVDGVLEVESTTVTIPAGQLVSNNFTVRAQVDDVDDGDQIVPIFAVAEEVGSTSANFTVVDVDTTGAVPNAITVTVLADTIVENAGRGATTATIVRTGPTDMPLTVDLSVQFFGGGGISERAEWHFDDLTGFSRTFAAGQNTINVDIDAVDNLDVDGVQLVRFIATPQTGTFDLQTDLLEVTDDGTTRGAYELQIRLTEVDEVSGSTVRFADIRFPANGIEILGAPFRSPLLGDATESLDGFNGGNDTFADAQDIGNLLASDRNTIDLSGFLSMPTDVDWYKFTVDFDLIMFPGIRTWATIFDIDYADGISRPDTTISVFDEQGNLLLLGRDSNVSDDQPRPLEGADTENTEAASFGVHDPFIGSVHLPEEDLRTYFIAIHSNATLPTAVGSTFADAFVTGANPLVKLEPIHGVQRLIEDHIGFTGYTSFGNIIQPVQGPLLPISNVIELDATIRPFTLSDVTLFVSQRLVTQPNPFEQATPPRLVTVDPFNPVFGEPETVVGTLGTNREPFQDIVLRDDGQLFGYRTVNSIQDSPNNAGRLVHIDPGTAGQFEIGLDGIPDDNDAEGDTQPLDPSTVTTNSIDALTYRNVFVTPTANSDRYLLYYSVREFGEFNPPDNVPSSRLFVADPRDATATVKQNRPGGPIGDIEPVSPFRIVVDIEMDDAATTVVGEGDGANAATATITRFDTSTFDLDLILSSSDPTEANWSEISVTIPANTQSIDVAIDVFDDAIFDGTQTVVLIAEVDPFGPSLTIPFQYDILGDVLNVTDDEVNALNIEFNVGAAQEQAAPGMPIPNVTDDIGRVRLNFPLDHDIEVDVVTSDPGEVKFFDGISEVESITVTILAGQITSNEFTLRGQDDNVFDDDQMVPIFAVAAEIGSTSANFLVIDIDDDMLPTDEDAITVTVLAASIVESDGLAATTAMIERDGPTVASLTVNLSVEFFGGGLGARAVWHFPTATFFVGQDTITVDIDALDNMVFDGTQLVRFIAEPQVAGLAVVTDILEVTDDDVPTISLEIVPDEVLETAGLNAATGTVTLNQPAINDTRVFLVVHDPSEISIQTLTISLDAAGAMEEGTPAQTDVLGRVTLLSPFPNNVDVTLVTSDPGEVLFFDGLSEVESITVTVLAGQTVSSDFTVRGQSDSVDDGDQVVKIFAVAAEVGSTFAEFVVQDVDTTGAVPDALTVRVMADSVRENSTPFLFFFDTATTATITRDGPTDMPLTVDLSVEFFGGGTSPRAFWFGTQLFTFSSEATFFEGQDTITVDVAVSNNLAFDGTQLVRFIATPRSGTFDLQSDILEVIDDELDLTPFVVVPAGMTQATFPIDTVNDFFSDSTQTVVITAHAPGFTSGQDTIDVVSELTPLGFTTGMAFIQDPLTFDTLYGVSDQGAFFTISLSSGRATIINNFGVPFAGLARAPRNLDLDGDGEIGDLARTLFAIDFFGTLYAIDTLTGRLRTDVFPGGADRVETGLSNVSGLAFSVLDFNLWHPTVNRSLFVSEDGDVLPVPGHGINFSFDNSRDPEDFTRGVFPADPHKEIVGGVSFYFGLDKLGGGYLSYDQPDFYGDLLPPDGVPKQDTQFGVLLTRTQDRLTEFSRAVDIGFGGVPRFSDMDAGLAQTTALIGNNYNLPGGAHGSLITNSFSLDQFSASDKPTLYYNYFLETQNANSRSDGMRDAARVFATVDDPLSANASWFMLSTNNSVLDAELPDAITWASTADTNDPRQRVQEQFDTIEDPDTGEISNIWRQARIDLSEFAGETNIVLRFDFSTSGVISDPRHPQFSDPLPGDEFGKFDSPQRGQNNDFAGFFIDDIIIGFAERGEMVSGTVDDDVAFFDVPQHPDLTSEVLEGAYQLEIRRGTETQESRLVATTGETRQVRTYDTNDRLSDRFTLDLRSPLGSADEFAIATSRILHDGFDEDGYDAIDLALNSGLYDLRAGAEKLFILVTDEDRDIEDASLTRGGVFTDLFNADVTLHTVVNVQLVDTTPAPSTTALVVTSGGTAYVEDGMGGFTSSLGGDVTGDFGTTEFDYVDVGFATQGIVADLNQLRLGGDTALSFGAALLDALVNSVTMAGANFVDIVVLIDESGSMLNEPAALRDFIPILEAALVANGVGASPIVGEENRYGLVGFGSAVPDARAILVGSDLPEDGQTFFIDDGLRTFTFEFDNDNSVVGLNVPVPFNNNQSDRDIAETIEGVINATPGLASSARVRRQIDGNPFTPLVSDQVELFDVADAGPASRIKRFEDLGDANRRHEQGQLLIHSNVITQVSGFGIVVDAELDEAGLPHTAPTRNLTVLNLIDFNLQDPVPGEGLVPGITIENNVIAFSGQGGIRFSGNANPSDEAASAVPFGRIINNTLFGDVTATGVGIELSENVSPTLLNNIVANFEVGIQGDLTSATTVVGGILYQGNTLNTNIGQLGSFPIVLEMGDPLFVDASMGEFLLAEGSLAIDSSIDSLEDRPEIVAVNQPLGTPPSPILAPDRDLFFRFRQDDPTVAPPPGLGAAIFKDRGAIEGVVDSGALSISIDDVTVSEGDSGTIDAVFTVSLSAPSALLVTVDFETVADSATADVDYTTTTSPPPLEFMPGQLMKEIIVPVIGDLFDEGDEIFFVELMNPMNATISKGQGIGTISDDDGVVVISISINDIEVNEIDGGDTGSFIRPFTVSLSVPVPAGQTVTVQYTTADGTATEPDDYLFRSEELLFNPGETEKPINVQINGDTIPEPDETFFVNLFSPTNAQIADFQGQATIIDDDGFGPQVTDVLVRGQTLGQIWSEAFLTQLEMNGLGTGGYSIPVGSSSQLSTLPYSTIDQIKIVFDENVTIAETDLSLVGVNVPNYAFAAATFSYDPISFTATWTLASPVGIDKLLLHLADTVQNSSGAALDGDWVNESMVYPSGNGSAGGDFDFRINVAPGDYTNNGFSDGADFTIWANNFGLHPGDALVGEGDGNADGFVDGADYTVWANFAFQGLPGPDPTLGADSGGPSGGGVDGELPGDANGDGTVDAADYTNWVNNFGIPQGDATVAQGDFDGDGFVTAADYTIWANNFGATLAAESSASSSAAAVTASSPALLAGDQTIAASSPTQTSSTPQTSRVTQFAVSALLASGSDETATPSPERAQAVPSFQFNALTATVADKVASSRGEANVEQAASTLDRASIDGRRSAAVDLLLGYVKEDEISSDEDDLSELTLAVRRRARTDDFALWDEAIVKLLNLDPDGEGSA